MGDVEYEQPQDDFEIEISDLDEVDTAGTDTEATAQSGTRRSLLQPRFSPRQRKIQLVITSGVVMLALLLILGSTAPVQKLTSGILIQSTPGVSPSLANAIDLFYIQGSPPWGHLSIDGHRVSRLPIVGIDPPLRLSIGSHRLHWQANPFPAQDCTMSVPADFAKDTCIYDQATQVGLELYASIIRFSESLRVLPDAQRAALTAAAQTALDTRQSSEIVQPGEFYAVASTHDSCKLSQQLVLCFAAAKQSLLATLRFQLDTDTSWNAPCSSGGCIINGHDCRLFCDASILEGLFQPASSAVQGWSVVAIARSVWQYTTLDGQVVADDQADSFIGGMGSEHFVPLDITWDSAGWHVSVLFPTTQGFFSDPTCDSAQGDAESLINNIVINRVQIDIQEEFASGADLATGCVGVITPQDYVGSPPIVAYCLHRFGVLLAANDAAHRYWPYLPLADAYERQLAQRLASRV